MTSIRIAEAARDDLREIRIYSKSVFGVAQARDYLAGLRDAFVRIADRPAIGRSETDLRGDIRSLNYRSHRIYYRTDMRGIVVLRVLHQARDVGPAMGRR